MVGINKKQFDNNQLLTLPMLYFLIVLILITFAWAGMSSAPWVPTRKKDLSRIFELLENENGKIFLELGCGNGLILEEAEKRGFSAVGYEISLLPYFLAKTRKIFYKKNFRVLYRNFWKQNLQKADVVYFFLMPKVMTALSQKIITECRPGTKIVSYVFPIPNLKEIKRNQDENRNPIYLYEV